MPRRLSILLPLLATASAPVGAGAFSVSARGRSGVRPTATVPSSPRAASPSNPKVRTASSRGLSMASGPPSGKRRRKRKDGRTGVAPQAPADPAASGEVSSVDAAPSEVTAMEEADAGAAFPPNSSDELFRRSMLEQRVKNERSTEDKTAEDKAAAETAAAEERAAEEKAAAEAAENEASEERAAAAAAVAAAAAAAAAEERKAAEERTALEAAEAAKRAAEETAAAEAEAARKAAEPVTMQVQDVRDIVSGRASEATVRVEQKEDDNVYIVDDADDDEDDDEWEYVNDDDNDDEDGNEDDDEFEPSRSSTVTLQVQDVRDVVSGTPSRARAQQQEEPSGIGGLLADASKLPGLLDLSSSKKTVSSRAPSPEVLAAEKEEDGLFSFLPELPDLPFGLGGNVAADDAADDAAADDDEDEWEYVDDDGTPLGDDEEWVYEDDDDQAPTGLEGLLADARAMRDEGEMRSSNSLSSRPSRDVILDEAEVDGLLSFLPFNLGGAGGATTGAGGGGGIVRDVIGSIVAVDFFLVLGLLAWFLSGIFIRSAFDNDSVQIAFNNNFEVIVQPALGILMIGSAAGAVMGDGDDDDDEK